MESEMRQRMSRPDARRRWTGARVAAWMLPFAMLAAGCAPLSQSQSPPPQSVVVTPRVSDAERAFMARAAAGGLYEVEVSRLAADRAISPRVRAYARMVAERNSQAIDELSALMRAKGVPPPAGLAADKATKLHRLSALKPSANFDLGYVRVVGVEDHTATIAMFEKARARARDRDLLAWIDRTLPALRQQLAMAKDLNGSIAL